MRFLSPRIDVAFKKLFGDKEHTEVTRDFLNAALERKNGTKIIEVTIQDPTNSVRNPEDKKSFVDVHCTDEKGVQYIVEMQITNQKHFMERVLYYVSRNIINQLASRDKYLEVKPVILLAIFDDFTFFKNKKFQALTHHFITEQTTHEQTLPEAEFHFIELAKFTKNLKELKTDIDRWMYFFKEVDALEKIPKELAKDDALVKAFDILEESTWKKKELISYENSLDIFRQKENRVELIKERGIKKGEVKKRQSKKVKKS